MPVILLSLKKFVNSTVTLNINLHSNTQYMYHILELTHTRTHPRTLTHTHSIFFFKNVYTLCQSSIHEQNNDV
jgi:hypothetical protein